MRMVDVVARTGILKYCLILSFHGVLITATIQTAIAEIGEVRIGMGFGIGYLPLLIMQQEKLTEKYLQASGLADTKVSWVQLGSGAAMNDALLAGDLHFASGGTPPFLLLWDKTRNSIDVKGVGALVSMPNFL